jgi:hypothetical protein
MKMAVFWDVMMIWNKLTDGAIRATMEAASTSETSVNF